MKFEQVINLAIVMFSKECSMIIIPSSNKVNNFWKWCVFKDIYIKLKTNISGIKSYNKTKDEVN